MTFLEVLMSSFFIGKITLVDLWVLILISDLSLKLFFLELVLYVTFICTVALKLYSFCNVVLYVTFCDVQTRDEQYLGVHSWYLTLEMNESLFWVFEFENFSWMKKFLRIIKYFGSKVFGFENLNLKKSWEK